ncbi:MAG: terpene cyclase/mutase family protein [Acidobacteria bacterium]|nr:terpene cyclase/mutase family protein [Acidobacteriota bacterium]
MPSMEALGLELIRSQNADGGWGFQAGKPSWSEPTGLAALALRALDRDSPQARRGVNWLRRQARPDGGLSPSPAVRQSCWVTALSVLADSMAGEIGVGAPSVQWLLSRTGVESTLLVRLRLWLLGEKWEADNSLRGWPWLPGSTAWVAPTAWTIAALTHVHRRAPDPLLQERIQEGRRFLLSRQCRDGGWNYGASRALGYDSASYPETTGMALFALKGERSGAIDRALARAAELSRHCDSVHAGAWLSLGLSAHNRNDEWPDAASPRYHTVPDAAMDLLARLARTAAGPAF